MENEKYYFWEESICRVSENPRKKYYLRGLDWSEQVFDDLVSVANYSKKVFYKKGKHSDEFRYKSLIFYHCISNNVEGKPHIEVFREGTVVRGATDRDDLLHRLNDEILSVLEANLE